MVTLFFIRTTTIAIAIAIITIITISGRETNLYAFLLHPLGDGVREQGGVEDQTQRSLGAHDCHFGHERVNGWVVSWRCIARRWWGGGYRVWRRSGPWRR
jgi:hypothetical protein